MIWVPVLLWLFSCQVMFTSLWPHELQHTRLLYPSPYPGVCSDSCPLSWWCYPTISSCVIPFSSCPQSFPASGSFPVSCIRWPKYWSFSHSPSNEYSRLFPLGVTGLISLLSRGLSVVFSTSGPYVAWASPVKVRALLAWRQHSRVHQNQTDLWTQTQSTLFTWTQLLFFSFLIW